MPSDDVAKFDVCGVNMNADKDNLVDLDTFSEGSILHHIRKRFYKDKIYTYVGSILVAVNPFKPLHIYGKDLMVRAECYSRSYSVLTCLAASHRCHLFPTLTLIFFFFLLFLLPVFFFLFSFTIV